MTGGSRKKVIVTGGAGFIGSHTAVELHAAGYDPIVADDFSNSEDSAVEGIAKIVGDEISYHRVDCNDRAALRRVFEKEGEIFGAIHFAASKAVGESVAKPLHYYRNNLGSLLSLLDVMIEFETRPLVFSSSCTVYGQPEVLPVTEASPIARAESPYGATKQVCESILEDSARAGLPLKTMILRYFNPIGAHPSSLIGELPIGPPDNLVPFITQTCAGIRDQLTVFGDDYDTPDGSCVRDYIHVVDLAQAHVASLEWLENQSAGTVVEKLNLGTGEGTSVFEVISAFEKVSARSVDYSVGARRPGDVEKVYADVSRSHEVLGWRATRSLEDAMRDAWNWELALQERRGKE